VKAAVFSSQESMASSKDNLYQRPNYAIDGIVPNYFRRPALPAWITPPNFQPNQPPWPTPPSAPPPPGWGFPDPTSPLPMPRSHDVDPPEENPYNDPDYNPNFLVTKNLSGPASNNWFLAYFDRLKSVSSDDKFVDGASVQPGPVLDRQGIADGGEEPQATKPSADQLFRAYRQLTSRVVR
jgi:hypothetical protein